MNDKRGSFGICAINTIIFFLLGLAAIVFGFKNLADWSRGTNNYFAGTDPVPTTIALDPTTLKTDIMFKNNTQFNPKFIVDGNNITFGPPGYVSPSDSLGQGTDISQMGGDIPNVINIFTTSLSFIVKGTASAKANNKQPNIILEEFAGFDYYYITMNGIAIDSGGYTKNITNISIGNIITPLTLTYTENTIGSNQKFKVSLSDDGKASISDFSTGDQQFTANVGKSTPPRGLLLRKNNTFVLQSDGTYTITFILAAIGTGNLYFKLSYTESDYSD